MYCIHLLILDALLNYFLKLKNQDKSFIKQQNQNLLCMPRPKTLILNNQKYKRTKTIGKGGFGEVFLVEKLETQERFAYKQQISNPNEYDFTENEAKIMYEFDNENVLKVLEYGKNETNSEFLHWYLMEYTELGSLRNFIEGNKEIDIFYALNLFLQILNGLKYIHQKDDGYVHRDLKPDNILVFQDDNLKISDFGLLKKVDESTRTNTFKGAGSLPYMAPELFIKDTRATFKSDIYALGVIFFQILTGGELPYKTDVHDWYHIHDNPERFQIQDFRQDVDWTVNWRLKKLVNKLTKPIIQDRYESCDQIIDDLGSIIGNSNSFIPDTILERASGIIEDKNQAIVKEKIEKQEFENKNAKIKSICNAFVETLENTFLEFNSNSENSIEINKRSNGIQASFDSSFLDFRYELVIGNYASYKNNKNVFEKRPVDTQYILPMYFKHNVVAGGFLTIGKNSQKGSEYTEHLTVSRSWGCNFLLVYNHENQECVWCKVESRFGLISISHRENSFCIENIPHLMRFGSRKFEPFTDIVQNTTSEFMVSEENFIQFLDKLIV